MAMSFETRLLANGLTVKSYQNEHLHSVCFHIFFHKTAENIPGMAHLVEHMCFRNLAGLPQRELYHQLDCLGASLQGATTNDGVYFELEVVPAYFEQALAILLRLFAAHEWSGAELDAEKQVVLRQIERKDDWWLFYQKEAGFYYMGTPYEHPIMGGAADIARVSVQALNAYKEHILCPSNGCVVITGAYSERQLEQALDLLAGLPGAKQPAGAHPPARKVESFLRRGAASDKIIATTYGYANVRLSFDIDPARVNRYAAEYLFNILGYGVPSRLSLCLREDLGLIDDLDGGTTFNPYASRMIFDYEIKNEWLPQSLRTACEVLQQAKADIGDDDIRANRVFYIENQSRYADEAENLGYMLGNRAFIADEGIDSIDDLIAKYQGITCQEVKEAAETVLCPQNLIIAVSNNDKIIKKAVLRQTLADCRRILEG